MQCFTHLVISINVRQTLLISLQVMKFIRLAAVSHTMTPVTQCMCVFFPSLTRLALLLLKF